MSGTGIAGAMDYQPRDWKPGVCFCCGKPLVDNAGHSARAMPGFGVVQVCSAACAQAPAFAGKWELRP